MENGQKREVKDIAINLRSELEQALKTCAELETVQIVSSNREAELEQKIDELETANRELNTRLDKAKEFFLKNKEEAANAEKRIRATIARNMQKGRDEIYTIGNAVHEYAVALAVKPSSRMTAVQVNNLQAALSSLITVLEDNGLWDPERDLKPDLSVPEKVEKPKAPRAKKTKKKEETGGEQLDLIESTVQMAEDKAEE